MYEYCKLRVEKRKTKKKRKNKVVRNELSEVVSVPCVFHNSFRRTISRKDIFFFFPLFLTRKRTNTKKAHCILIFRSKSRFKTRGS